MLYLLTKADIKESHCMTRLTELGILDRLASSPDESMLLMSTCIYDILAGTQLRKLSVYYSIMGFLSTKSKTHSGVYLDYSKLLSKLIAIGVTINFKEACTADDPSDLFIAIAKPETISVLCDISEGICNISGNACTRSVVSKIAFSYLHQLMLSAFSGDEHSHATDADWLIGMSTHKPIFTKLTPEHSIEV